MIRMYRSHYPLYFTYIIPPYCLSFTLNTRDPDILVVGWV